MATDAQYQRLLKFRTALRQFDQWSREAAESHGLTHGQHQLLLAIRGSSTEGGPTVGEIAEALLVKPHTATEMIDRAHEIDLVVRIRDASDGRRVRLQLTAHGAETLAALTDVHVEELRSLAPLLAPVDPV
ncbi:MAG TPA: MarR family transcriptional regulator [Marmoricola sp.]|nr:MarR family transcriptional regulator [Marmoricola sp.]